LADERVAPKSKTCLVSASNGAMSDKLALTLQSAQFNARLHYQTNHILIAVSVSQSLDRHRQRLNRTPKIPAPFGLNY